MVLPLATALTYAKWIKSKLYKPLSCFLILGGAVKQSYKAFYCLLILGAVFELVQSTCLLRFCDVSRYILLYIIILYILCMSRIVFDSGTTSIYLH